MARDGVACTCSAATIAPLRSNPGSTTLATDVQPVVFNSWVLHYFDKPARAAHVQRMRELVQRRGIAWLSAEGAHIPLGDAPPAEGGDAAVSDEQLAQGSLWWLTLLAAKARRRSPPCWHARIRTGAGCSGSSGGLNRTRR